MTRRDLAITFALCLLLALVVHCVNMAVLPIPEVPR